MPSRAKGRKRGQGIETINAVRTGLPAEELDELVQKLAIDRSILLHVLGISNRTLQRRVNSKSRLSPAASDRLSRVNRIYRLAADVFGDEHKAAAWLKRSSRALHNQMPFELLDTDAGTERVEQELRAIEHGFAY